MTDAIIDTSVIVHLYRKSKVARAWLDAQTITLSVTPITWLEIMVGAPNKQSQIDCHAVLDLFNIEYLTPSDVDWAVQQLIRHHLSSGVGTNDCLIASVCHRLQISLYTDNIRHMGVLLPRSLVVQPYLP